MALKMTEIALKIFNPKMFQQRKIETLSHLREMIQSL